jgi:hypothetical protein
MIKITPRGGSTPPKAAAAVSGDRGFSSLTRIAGPPQYPTMRSFSTSSENVSFATPRWLERSTATASQRWGVVTVRDSKTFSPPLPDAVILNPTGLFSTVPTLRSSQALAGISTSMLNVSGALVTMVSR